MLWSWNHKTNMHLISDSHHMGAIWPSILISSALKVNLFWSRHCRLPTVGNLAQSLFTAENHKCEALVGSGPRIKFYSSQTGVCVSVCMSALGSVLSMINTLSHSFCCWGFNSRQKQYAVPVYGSVSPFNAPVIHCRASIRLFGVSQQHSSFYIYTQICINNTYLNNFIS